LAGQDIELLERISRGDERPFTTHEQTHRKVFFIYTAWFIAGRWLKTSWWRRIRKSGDAPRNSRAFKGDHMDDGDSQKPRHESLGKLRNMRTLTIFQIFRMGSYRIQSPWTDKDFSRRP